MDRDAQLQLYELVASRLKEAHARVRSLRIPEGERMALSRKLLAITAAAKHDLPRAARRLDRFMQELDDSRLRRPFSA
ncbi:hypothetical protein [Streptomyces zingiberis]|uniref:Uncharacterized protein n=1 Tax=Streptomyces zingiberis TaxID=2053010 RepID=A0ABX1C2I7_9ACTN|nr:hypothetical protein [Streptomyces zingiberis]NJQ02335.1 hypothetical protein [Streptomyces zingiberis]